jgi:ABC-type branched-subunit amino acid transport system substrate-binding protein
MVRFKQILLLAVVATTVTTAACGSSGGSSASDSRSKPFTILMDADFTGPGKAYGDQFQLGVQAAADYINQTRGGILGHKIVVKTVSDNFDATQAVSVLIKYLSSNPAPDLTFAGTGDTETAALFPILQRKGLLGWSGNDGGGLLENGGAQKLSLQFSTQASTVPVTQKVVQWMQQQHYSHVGILQEDNAYSAAETADAEKAISAAGMTDTVVSFSTSALSLASQVQELKSAGCDVVFFEGLTQPFGYAIQAAQTNLGWNVPWIVDLSASSLDLTSVAKPAQLKDVWEINFRPNVAGVNLPGLALFKKYAASLTSMGTLNAVPADIVSLAWDGVLMVANAAEQAKSIEATAIAKALDNFGAGASDPDYLDYAQISFSTSDHTPVSATPNDYPIVKAGPISGGQVQPAGS